MADLDNELNALIRQFKQEKPSDTLQFCANYFHRRLESQRAESLLSSPTNKGAPAMAESSFPGSNPFISSSDRSIQRVDEEEEEDFDAPRGPTASSHNFPGGFGTTGFLAKDDGANLPQDYNFNRRTSVSAESMNPAASASDNWTPPSHPKTSEQEARLRNAVANNFLFNHLDEAQTKQVLGALQEKPIPAKDIKVISQGDSGDYFYVVEKGRFLVHVNPAGKIGAGVEGLGNKVAEIGPGGSFGELALMYNAPRAATVISTESSTLWALDRVTFRRILMDNAFQRRQMYEAFLSEVKLFESLTSYERAKIADALHTQKYPAGHTIIQEGDPGESFFILESGEAEVFKRGKEGPITKYGKGDYFGELALLDDKPRAASVISSSEVKLATLGKEGFQRLLGPVEELMRRNDPSRQLDTDDVDPLAPAA